MAKKHLIRWLPKPEAHDYPAALSYLRLLHDDRAAPSRVNALKKAPMSAFKSKDIFRASGLSLLGVSNAHVPRLRARLSTGPGTPFIWTKAAATAATSAPTPASAHDGLTCVAT
jgi:hypothetical protein